MSTTAKRISKPLATLFVLVLLLIASAIPAHAADLSGAKKALANGLKNNQTVIDLTSYYIPHGDFNDYYDEWINKGNFPWYVKTYTYYYRNGYITTVHPEYWDPGTYSRTKYNKEFKHILDEAIDPDMSDWQMALSLYNHLAAQTSYSQNYPKKGGIQRNAYGVIVNKDAVCLGYARAYMELLKECGIKSVVVVSDDMNHAWNLVLIRGNWYHVDVTWGDPLYSEADAYGRVDHNYFLLSDAAIADSKHNHHGWTRYYSCPDTFFDTNTFWNDMNNHIWYMDNTVSFMRQSTNTEIKIIRRDEYTGQQTVLCNITPTLVNITGQNLYYYNFGISLWNDTIYFSDAAKVYAISPAGGTPQVIFTYDTKGNGKTILGSYVHDDVMYLTVKTPYDQTSRIAYYLPKTSHTHNFNIVDHEPTCMAKGYTQFTCSCGDAFTSGQLNIVDHRTGQFTVTAEPTWSTAGSKVAQCVWCKKNIRTTLPALSSVSGTFRDVSGDAYYNQSVLWAYVRGITDGVSATSFAPSNTCTRGQVVTFLWRAAGCPEPKSTYNPFKDVTSDAYYYKAVLWAVENRITDGTSPTTFAPNSICTRGHVVTFLWRAAGCPAPMEPNRIPFTDVANGAYYTTAMVWAVENGITDGTGPATFSPNNSCSRAQVVTFLWRYLCPTHQHSYASAESAAASCMTDGYELMVCTCGDSYKEIIAKTGSHNLTEIERVEPTYTEQGYIVLQCNACGCTFTEYLDVLPQPTVDPAPAPTEVPVPHDPVASPEPVSEPTLEIEDLEAA